MHLETSISFATLVSCRSGGGRSRVAERRTTSPGPRFDSSASTGGLETAVSGSGARVMPRPSRRGRLLEVDEERLELRRLDVGVTDERGQRVRAEALARRTGEAPVQRDADDVHGLAVAGHGLQPLGDHRLRLDLAALGPDPHPVAAADALLRRRARPRSRRRTPAAAPRSPGCAWSSSGSARSAGRRSPRRGTPPQWRSRRRRSRTPAPPDCRASAGSGGWGSGVSNGSMWVGNGPSRIRPRLNRRETPSGFMMNGITSPGLAVGAMSGTS